MKKQKEWFHVAKTSVRAEFISKLLVIGMKFQVNWKLKMFFWQYLSIYRRWFCLGTYMTNLYPFIQGWLKWRFPSKVSSWNQYKYIAFNVFSCRISIISYKILINTGMSNEKTNHIWSIMLKRRNILPAGTPFIPEAGKIENVQEFKIKLFKYLFHCRWQSYKNCVATCSSFQRTWHFWDNVHLFKYYPVKVPQNCFNSFSCSNQTNIQVSEFSFVLDK